MSDQSRWTRSLGDRFEAMSQENWVSLTARLPAHTTDR